MNIPVGKVVEKRQSFEETAPYEMVMALLKAGFNGYVVATIEGPTGIEEALFLIRGKEITGAIFEAGRSSKIFYGLEALQLGLNLLRAEKGVFDVNALTIQQIDLIVAFNDKLELRKPVNKDVFAKLLPSSYHPDATLRKLKDWLPEAESKENVLKRFGLGSI